MRLLLWACLLGHLFWIAPAVKTKLPTLRGSAKKKARLDPPGGTARAVDVSSAASSSTEAAALEKSGSMADVLSKQFLLNKLSAKDIHEHLTWHL